MENKNQLQVLNRRIDFQNLKTKGKKVWACRWLLVVFRKNEEHQFRCGWTVSKKVGTAVTRNRLKRWCREFFRDQDISELPVDLNVIFINPKKEKDFYKNLSFSEFNECISAGWNQISRRMS